MGGQQGGELSSGDGAVVVGTAHIVERFLRQEGDDVLKVLVADHPEDDAQLAAGHCVQLAHCEREPSHVVAHVAEGERLLAQHLPATAEAGVADDVFHGGAHHVLVGGPELLQHLHGLQEGDQILALVLAAQGQVEVLVQHVPRHIQHGAVVQIALYGVVVLREEQGRVALVGDVGEDGETLGMELPDDHGRVGLDDACFLESDLGNRVAQHLGVLQRDVGYDGEQGTEHVGAVESPAQAHFHDGHIYLLLGKIVEGQRGGHLEKRGLQLVELGLEPSEELHDCLLGNHLAVNADALAEVHEMGRGEQAGFQAAFLTVGGHQVGHRPLAVGAGNVHGLQPPLGIAHNGKQRLDVLQSLFVGRRPDFVVHRVRLEYLFQKFVVHF